MDNGQSHDLPGKSDSNEPDKKEAPKPIVATQVSDEQVDYVRNIWYATADTDQTVLVGGLRRRNA